MQTVLDIFSLIVAITMVLDVCLLLFLIPKGSRRIASTGLFISSFIFGAWVWVFGLSTTYTYLGLFWTIAGLLFAGVGAVPLGILASLLHGDWKMALGLAIGIIVVFGLRMLALWANESSERYQVESEDSIIEGEVVEITRNDKSRSWKDVRR